MTERSPPFRAEHVGSFVRPGRLLEAVRARRAGTMDAETLRTLQDECIAEIVAFQDEIGMPSVTDGEFRRRSWSAGVIDALDGLGLREEGVLAFKTAYTDLGVASSPYAAAPLSRRRPIVADDFRFLDVLCSEDNAALAELSDAEMRQAGSSTGEVRAWIMLAGAFAERRAEQVFYQPIRGFDTGCGQVLIR